MKENLCSTHARKIVAHYYSKSDLHWIQDLIDVFYAHVDYSWRDLSISLQESQNIHWYGKRYELILQILSKIFLTKINLQQSPKIIRENIFLQAEHLRFSQPHSFHKFKNENLNSKLFICRFVTGTNFSST